MDTTTLSRRTVLLTGATLLGPGVASGNNQSEDSNESEATGDSPEVQEPQGEQEEEGGEGDENTPGLRLVNIAPDVPAIDVSIDGEDTVEGLSHLDPNVGPLPVPEEVTEETTVTVSGTPTDGSLPEGAETEVDIPVNDTPPVGGWTVFFVGEQCATSDRPFRPVLIPDDHTPTPDGMSRITATHFSPDSPTGNVRLKDGTLLFEEVEFGEWKRTTIPAVDSQVTIETAETGEELHTYPIRPEIGEVYTASLMGYQDPENVPSVAAENPPPGADDWSLVLAISEDSIPGLQGEGEWGVDTDVERDRVGGKAQGNERNQTNQ